MGNNALNLTLRFILELVALFAAGYWAYKTIGQWPKYLLMLLVPVIIATIWGVFAVPSDPSRSGKTVVAVPGLVRLVIELAVFGFGTWCIYKTMPGNYALIFAVLVIFHYAISYDRIFWLLKR
jgi:hypothetical protein